MHTELQDTPTPTHTGLCLIYNILLNPWGPSLAIFVSQNSMHAVHCRAVTLSTALQVPQKVGVDPGAHGVLHGFCMGHVLL